MSDPLQPPVFPNPITPAGLGLILLIGLIGLLAVSYHSFGIKPVADDFPYAHEIDRGEQQGPMALLTRSFTGQTYRPLTSLCIWLVGRGPVESRPMRLRLLGYFFMTMYGLVAALWVWSMRLRRAGAIVALLMLVFHPVVPASLCSIDGFNSLASTAFLWLGVWMVWQLEDRRALACAGVLGRFLIGAGFKEYVFALVPLSAWTALLMTRRRRGAYAVLVAIAVACGFALVLLSRHLTMPPGGGAEDYFKLNPVAWVQNFVLFCVGLLFFGDSIWAYVRQDTVSYAAVAASITLAMIALAAGLRLWLIDSRRSGEADQPRRWILFLVGALAMSMFPAIFTIRISEMYTAPLLLPLALFAGLAADGWRWAPAAARWSVSSLAVVALICSCFAIHTKTASMVDAGDRAERQLRQLLDILGPGAHDLHVCILFDPKELPARRAYSVYRMGDDTLLVQPIAFEWLAPGRGLVLQSFWTGDPAYDPRQYDIVLKWDPQAHKFNRVEIGARL